MSWQSPTVAFHTLGCKLNFAETAAIARTLSEHGYSKLEFSEPADFFVICEGDSNVHVKSISDGVHKRVKEETGANPVHMEGSMNARWVLMDYFSTVVHVFYPETRLFYELEQLWSDAKVTEFADI